MFGPEDLNDPYYNKIINNSIEQFKIELLTLLEKNNTIKYKNILKWGLEKELIHKQTIQKFILKLKNDGTLKIHGMSKRQKIPKENNIIEFID